MFLCRLCFRLVSFTWGLYPWASAFSEEAHWTGSSLLGSCGLCRVCSMDECSLCFTVKLPWWENHVNQATVKSACNRFLGVFFVSDGFFCLFGLVGFFGLFFFGFFFCFWVFWFFFCNQFLAQHKLCALIWWYTELSWVMPYLWQRQWDPGDWDLWMAKGSSSAAPVCACEQFLVPQLRTSSAPGHGSGWGFNSITQTFAPGVPKHIPEPWSHSRRSGIGRGDFWTSPLCFFKIPGFNLWRSWWKGQGHWRLFQLSLLEHQVS